MTAAPQQDSEGTGQAQPSVAKPSGHSRGWLSPMLRAAAVTGFGVALSATINPALDRRIHWDWTTGLAVISFALLAVAFRK